MIEEPRTTTEITPEPQSDPVERPLSDYIRRSVVPFVLFRRNKQSLMPDILISKWIKNLDDRGAMTGILNGSPTGMPPQEVLNLVESKVKLSVGQNLRADVGPLRDLERDSVNHATAWTRLNASIHQAETNSTIVHVISIIFLVLGMSVLPWVASASVLHLIRDNFYYSSVDLYLERVVFYSDIFQGSLLWTLGLNLILAAYSIRKSLQSVLDRTWNRRWVGWLGAICFAILLAGLALYLLFNFGLIDDIVITFVTYPILAHEVFVGTMFAGIVIFSVNRFLIWRIRNREPIGQEARREQQAFLLRRDAEFLERTENQITEIIQTAIISVGNDPGFRVVAEDKYGLRVPNYDQYREGAWKGLTETYDNNYVDVVPPTGGPSYFHSLINSIDNLQRGSFGISGERGAGKTSLMYALKNHMRVTSANTRQYLDVWLGAPTSISEQAFLLSVLAKLASRVGSHITHNSYFPHGSPEDELQEGRKKWRNMALIFALSAGAVIAGLADMLLLETRILDGLSINQKLGFGLPLLALGPILIWGWRWRRKLVIWDHLHAKLDGDDNNMIHAARNVLEQLWFDQRETVSSSAGVSGMGVDFSGGWSKERTRRPFTLPQLVQMWDDFVFLITTGPKQFTKVVIFIDEVDKIKDTEEIDRFMRILKTLYRPPNLFFIVSISEDAYELYQKRSVVRGQRNVFDSAFDQFTKVTVMTSDNLLDMLHKRILGAAFPRPFIQLIWLISRGNPRDCVRYARDLVQFFQTKELSEATPHLIREYQYKPLIEQYKPQVESLLKQSDYQTVISAAEKFGQALEDDVTTAVDFLEPFRMIILQKETAALHKGQEYKDTSPVDALWKFGAGLYITYTLWECYGAPTESAQDGRFQKIDDIECLKTLRDAHQELHDGNPFQAWTKISEFRVAAGLPAIGFLGKE